MLSFELLVLRTLFARIRETLLVLLSRQAILGSESIAIIVSTLVCAHGFVYTRQISLWLVGAPGGYSFLPGKLELVTTLINSRPRFSCHVQLRRITPRTGPTGEKFCLYHRGYRSVAEDRVRLCSPFLVAGFFDLQGQVTCW